MNRGLHCAELVQELARVICSCSTASTSLNNPGLLIADVVSLPFTYGRREAVFCLGSLHNRPCKGGGQLLVPTQLVE